MIRKQRCIHASRALFVAIFGCILVGGTFTPIQRLKAADEKSEFAPAREFDAWYRVSIGGAPIGHMNLTSKEAKLDDGTAVLEYRTETFMQFERDGDTAEVKESSIQIEDHKGSLIRFRINQQMGDQKTVISGVQRDGKLVITSSTDDSKRTLDVDKSWLSNLQQFALIGELYKQELKGTLEKREKSYTSFDTQIMSPVKVTMTVKGVSDTGLEKPWNKGLQITMKQDIQGNLIHSTNWFARNGEMLKSEIAGFGMSIERVKKDTALKLSSKSVDLFGITSIQAAGKINLLEDETHELRISVKRDKAIKVEDDHWKIVSYGPNQIVSQTDAASRSTLITTLLSSGEKTDEKDIRYEPVPESEFLKPSALIQSEAEPIKTIAAKHRKDDAMVTARALEIEVGKIIDNANYKNVFDSALTVLEKKEGDCSEHAVLLVALCRAAGIPSRVATGLVGIQKPDSDEPVVEFFYHMWTEVYAHGRWQSLDATLGIGGITTGHIKLNDTSLADGNEAALLGITNLIGRIEIKIVD